MRSAPFSFSMLLPRRSARSGDGGSARPHRAMAKNRTASGENVFHAGGGTGGSRCTSANRILTTDASQVLAITPHAYMGHVYLTGFVANQAQADDIVARVRAVEGVRTVDTYLVPKPSDRSIAN